MIRQPAHVEAGRPPLRGICLVVKKNQPADHPKPAVPIGMMTKFPRRPDSGVLSESIPLFFIARNRAGLWIAREAQGRTGGIFCSREGQLGGSGSEGSLRRSVCESGCCAPLRPRREWISTTSGGHGFGESRTGHER
jgi:hypothetical protein